jgi:hypothetical protein
MKRKKGKALFQVGDLFTELVDGLNLSLGLVTKILYDKNEQEYVYMIMWNDMSCETQISEFIIKWRIENRIFGYYPVVK